MNSVLIALLIGVILYYFQRKKGYRRALIYSLGASIITWYIMDTFNNNSVEPENNIVYSISSDEYTCTKKLPNIFVEMEDFTI